MKRIEFGVLPVDLKIETASFKIELAEEYLEVVKKFRLQSNPDGYFYPPILATYEGTWDGPGKKVDYSEREATVFRVPGSHILSILHPENWPENEIPLIADLIVYYLGFVFGYRCQTSDRWLDGRTNTKAFSDHSAPNNTWIKKSLGIVNNLWERLDDRRKGVLLNALFLHNRASGYRWDWERFMIEYQVTDALYRIANKAHNVVARRHADRIQAMCDKYDVWYTRELIDNVVDLRNDLLHEALWDGNIPTSSSHRGVVAPGLLHSLNERLFFGILGYKGNYLQSKWSARVLHLFDLKY